LRNQEARLDGHVEAIFIAGERKVPLSPVTQVLAVAQRGLEGDRYWSSRGSFSRWPGAGRAVSLVEAEALDAAFAETGIDLRNGRSRRNIVTRGVRLDDLNGKPFRIGGALLLGVRACAPCAFLERLTQPGAFAALKGRGGLRAEVLEDGVIRCNDAIVPVTAADGHRVSR
jgi:MOSC domain-containing protein YiiM